MEIVIWVLPIEGEQTDQANETHQYETARVPLHEWPDELRPQHSCYGWGEGAKQTSSET